MKNDPSFKLLALVIIAGLITAVFSSATPEETASTTVLVASAN
jgi:hypothetical protein